MVLDVSSDERGLEGDRRAQAAELVAVQRTARIEPEAQDALVRDSTLGQVLERCEQQAKADRPALLRRQRRLECGRKRLAQEIDIDPQGSLRWPLSLHVAGEVRRVGVSTRHREEYSDALSGMRPTGRSPAHCPCG
jgi:hypothetical protein